MHVRNEGESLFMKLGPDVYLYEHT